LALSRRGRITAIVAGIVAVILVGLGAVALFTGKNPVSAVTQAVAPDPPPTCPLSGTPAPAGSIPDRGVVAVKVENTTDAYPQDGVDKADIVYEEVVEGGITRWVALYQCAETKRVGPVRSVRTTDPDILLQPPYGKPILAYSGGANKVVKIANRAGLHLVDETSGGDAFTRDPNRVEPHNLFVSVPKVRKVEKKYAAHAPDPMFAYTPYDQLDNKGKKAHSLSMTFSSLASVSWVWKNVDGGAWWREDDGKPNVLQSGDQIGAQNVIVQYVKAVPGPYSDVVGSPSPLVTMTGKGKAVLLRNGRQIAGSWSRPSLKDATTFTAKDGSEFQLEPGQTWVELYPAKGDFASDASIKISK
jgi:Protein of unknown function (DUF3048) N-terminal domain/Protein of unknown function (DUF3048) C-terminal domain